VNVLKIERSPPLYIFRATYRGNEYDCTRCLGLDETLSVFEFTRRGVHDQGVNLIVLVTDFKKNCQVTGFRYFPPQGSLNDPITAPMGAIDLQVDAALKEAMKTSAVAETLKKGI